MASRQNFLAYFRLLHIVSRFIGFNNYYLPNKRSAKGIFVRKLDFLIVIIQLVMHGIICFYTLSLLQNLMPPGVLFGKYLLGIFLMPFVEILSSNIIDWFNLDGIWFILSGLHDFDVTVSTICFIGFEIKLNFI